MAPSTSSSPHSCNVTGRRPLPNLDVHKDFLATSVPSEIQSAAQRRESARARRRVPASLRKRTRQSCDACKAKRCKCLRAGSTPDSFLTQDDSQLAPCKSCVDAGIECLTTLPRKQRIYGSVEQLDCKCRALDALVSGLFLDLPPNATPEELVEYGRERGVAMPDIGNEVKATRSRTTSSLNITSSLAPPNTGRRISANSLEFTHNNGHFTRDAGGRACYIEPWGSLDNFARVRDLMIRRLNASTDLAANRRGQRLAFKSVADGVADTFGEISTDILLPARQTPVNESIATGDSRCCVATSEIRLPDKELADICVNAFFNNVHPDFMLFHQPSFQKIYEDLWNQSGHRLSELHLATDKYVSVGWLCCLYLVFILGSRSMPQNSGALGFERTWYESMKELPPLLTMPTLPSVCALMLLALYHQGMNDSIKSWNYLGAAIRQAVALGMHRECANKEVGLITTEIRKRIWWTVYTYEQHLCCSLGRPSSIEDSEVSVGEPDERILQCVPALPREHLGVWVQLVRMQAAIRREVLVPDSSTINVIPPVVRLLRQLGAWRRGLPSALLPPSRNLAGIDLQRWRRIMLLHTEYQMIVNLLTRRFLLHEIEAIDQGVTPSQIALTINNLSKVCVTSSMRCAQLLLELWRAGKFNGVTALDTYYAYLCSTQICLRMLQPSHEQPLENYQSGTQSENLNFEAHKLRVETSELQLQGHLHFELEALVAQMNFAEQYNTAELTDTIRQIHDLLQTVPLSGFSAQCEAVSSEFAKVVGAVEEKPESTLIRGRMNVPTHYSESSVLPRAATFGNSMPPVVMKAVWELQQPYQQTFVTAAVDSNDVTGCALSGILPPNFIERTHTVHESQLQWDVIQPSEDWSSRNCIFTDMAANFMSWPPQNDGLNKLTNPPP